MNRTLNTLPINREIFIDFIDYFTYNFPRKQLLNYKQLLKRHRYAWYVLHSQLSKNLYGISALDKKPVLN